MKNEYKKLYTYCALDKNNNLVQEIESNEIDAWKKGYIKRFKEGYIDTFDKSLDVRSIYCDPDQTYKKGYNHHFFEQLVLFLNKREEESGNKLNGKYIYKFIEGEGIEVSGVDKNDVEIEPFYLRSDQFCFSAPSNEKSHPYDLYITKASNKDDAVEKVANWIISSRTIGGSFLWPRPFWDKYNPQRGGTITSNRRFYIQDRVDLTLWELYYWYNDISKPTIMKRCDEQNSNLRLWLKHFNDFNTYISFFCLENFAEKVDEQFYPIDIIRGEIHKLKWGINGENPEIEITKEMDIDTVQQMLERVNECVLKRSISIIS